MSKQPQVLAFYLPQYYSIPENDEWWGTGFTEWTNVGKAKPLFPGHYQPKVPADLGYYNLTLPEIREKQAELAKEAGICAFCYWHYWFEGKRLLERPFNEVLNSGTPDLPFSLFWANHSWYAKLWRKDVEDKLLIEQTYGGEEDYRNHFYEVLPAFKDKRYYRIDDKPIFGIYSHKTFPDLPNFIKIWQQLALENGLKGIFFLAIAFKEKDCTELNKKGIDASLLDLAFLRQSTTRLLALILHKIFKFPQIVSYNDYSKTLVKNMPVNDNIFPCIIPNFDHTPRSGRRGTVMINSTPKNWGRMLSALLHKMKQKSNSGRNIIFVKSWNEWGEGNYMEPDLKYGKDYLNVLRECLTSFQNEKDD
jgi:hypothetical protein